MSLRDYRDSLREAWVSGVTAPNRSIQYIPSDTSVAINLEAFIFGEEDNKDLPEDKKTNSIIFSGLKLEAEPTKLDTVIYNGKTFTVRDWKFLGTLYSVSAENEKRNSVTTRRFKSAN